MPPYWRLCSLVLPKYFLKGFSFFYFSSVFFQTPFPLTSISNFFISNHQTELGWGCGRGPWDVNRPSPWSHFSFTWLSISCWKESKVSFLGWGFGEVKKIPQNFAAFDHFVGFFFNGNVLSVGVLLTNWGAPGRDSELSDGTAAIWEQFLRKS